MMSAALAFGGGARSSWMACGRIRVGGEQIFSNCVDGLRMLSAVTLPMRRRGHGLQPKAAGRS